MTFDPRLLLVVAETPHGLLAKHLAVSGFAVSEATSLKELPQQLQVLTPDLALIAVAESSERQAIEVVKQLRQAALTIPLLLLLPAVHFTHRVQALEAGADDVLSHPFALEELTARLHALLRRSRMGAHHLEGALIRYRDLVVNTDQRRVSRAGQAIKLSVKEYDLLLYLFTRREQVLPRKEILHAVWGNTWQGDDNLLDVYIRYLRKKVERPELEQLIHTIRGVGYMIQ